MASNGRIRYPHGYRQSKDLDHGGFAGKLPRRITPSDIDMVLDNREHRVGRPRTLLIELSRRCSLWCELEPAQREVFEGLVRAGQGQVMAMLVQHATPLGEQVDTWELMQRSLGHVMGWRGELSLKVAQARNVVRWFYS